MKGTADLVRKLVETKKHIIYQLVYLLVILASILPVVTTTVEIIFSAMNIVKNRLRNRMRDQGMNDQLLVYIKKDIFNSIDNDITVQPLQNMKTRGIQL